MRAKRIPVALLLLCLAAFGVTATAADDGSAIVAELNGSATVREAGRQERTVQLYDWLEERATIAVAKGARVVLVLVTGQRFELVENARVDIARAGLPVSDAVRALPSIAPVPIVAPIARAIESRSSLNARKADSVAVIRVRGPITNLYPSDNSSTFADRTTLRFDDARGRASLRVVVKDEEGAPVFDGHSVGGHVAVPQGVLQPGRFYSWSVIVGDDAASPEAIATFQTLSVVIVEARDRFVASLPGNSARDLALRARIDERLGLLSEAVDEVSAAVKKAPDDDELARLLVRIKDHFDNRANDARR